jgi:hypothetical protein
MGDEAGAQIREIREMIINKTLDEGTCIDCDSHTSSHPKDKALAESEPTVASPNYHS